MYYTSTYWEIYTIKYKYFMTVSTNLRSISFSWKAHIKWAAMEADCISNNIWCLNWSATYLILTQWIFYYHEVIYIYESVSVDFKQWITRKYSKRPFSCTVLFQLHIETNDKIIMYCFWRICLAHLWLISLCNTARSLLSDTLSNGYFRLTDKSK